MLRSQFERLLSMTHLPGPPPPDPPAAPNFPSNFEHEMEELERRHFAQVGPAYAIPTPPPCHGCVTPVTSLRHPCDTYVRPL